VTYSAEQGCHVENVTYGLETFFVCLPFSAIFKKESQSYVLHWEKVERKFLNG